MFRMRMSEVGSRNSEVSEIRHECNDVFVEQFHKRWIEASLNPETLAGKQFCRDVLKSVEEQYERVREFCEEVDRINQQLETHLQFSTVLCPVTFSYRVVGCLTVIKKTINYGSHDWTKRVIASYKKTLEEVRYREDQLKYFRTYPCDDETMSRDECVELINAELNLIESIEECLKDVMFPFFDYRLI